MRKRDYDEVKADAQAMYLAGDRALLRGSAATNPSHGVLRERRKRGSNHLLHLPEIQSGMENPHPPPIYTTSLTLSRTSDSGI